MIIVRPPRQGFTLIELLVVIAVIGLLASVVLVSLGPARQKARDTKRESEFKQIASAMEMCYSDLACAGPQSYPFWTAGTNLANQTIDTDGTPSYLIIPADPKNDGDQIYKYIGGTSQNYCIAVKLENEANTWICVSNKGISRKTASPYTPTTNDCCGVNIAQ